jgi:cytoskeletal protein CcmA (bactofilin family)
MEETEETVVVYNRKSVLEEEAEAESVLVMGMVEVNNPPVVRVEEVYFQFDIHS